MKINKKNNKDLYLWAIIALAVALIASLIPASLSLSGTIENDAEKETEIVEDIPADTFGFIGDIRVLSESEIFSPDSESFQQYSSYIFGQRDIALSEAIFKSVVDEYLKSDVKAVFICGGLSEMGSEKSLLAVQEQCKRLEDGGKQVFVLNGTYDINFLDNPEKYDFSLTTVSVSFTETGLQYEKSVTKEEFSEIFADYGYNEAISRDETTLSYASDIQGTNCRVIALSANFFQYNHLSRFANDINNPEITEETLDWVEKQLIDAQEAGKEVIFMSYYPICEQVKSNMGFIAKSYSLHLQNQDILCSLLTQYGVKYALSAQINLPCETEYIDNVNTDEEGNPLHFTLLSTGSLCYYPASYTTISYKNGVFSQTKQSLSAIPEKYIPSYISEEVKEAVTTDLIGYFEEIIKDDTNTKMISLLNEYGIDNGMFLRYMELIGIYDRGLSPESQPEGTALAKELGDNIFLKHIHLPFYGKDIDSMESRLGKFDIVLPESDYVNFIDLLAHGFFNIYQGKEALPEGSVEQTLMIYSSYALVDIMVDFGLFDCVRPFFPDMPEFHWDKIHEQVMRTGICNLRYEEALLQFWSIINLFLNQTDIGTITFKSSDEIIKLLNIVIRPALVIALEQDYNTEDDTIFGIDLTDFLDLEHGTLNLKNFAKEIFFDIFLKEILF